MRSSAPARIREPFGRFGQERRDVGVGRTVLPMQLLQVGDPLADGLETLRIGKERLPVGAHVPGELRDLGGEPPGPLGHLRGRRIELRRALQDRCQPGRGVRDARPPR